ncbi:glycosyltransferase family 4 protein [Xanthomarina spongicola]|uniref:Phosphatidylinositol alpha-1,6-mannosyltransferase n=1 Tax=Xanthomarina spongicola TaxID=570520 RepID=A0A316DPC3_9FLAO|nr:glycosyltransferase family 4 protein [Xanthomarina spongicola]PWK18613.1 phosphatidylinositol alpha-1,6-mannosyltransferase [Xanthomarina spongicola]
MKHIVIVTSEFPPQPGGIGNHAYNLALYLSKNNYEVTVIADQRAALNEAEIKFDTTLPFLVERISLKKLRVLMYVNRIIKTLHTIIKGDFIIATGKFSLWNVALCTLFVKRPSMAVIHGTEVNFKSSSLRKAINVSLKRFDRIVAVSNYTKQLVTHLKKDVEVIPNGIDSNQWTTNILKIPLKGFPVITTVGRVSIRKGQLQVIKMLPDLLNDYPEIHYHCVGITSEAEAFLDEAKRIGVDKHITFHGVLNNDDLKRVLSSTDVFVMLSQESVTGDVEGFGIAILEANAIGIPAIGAKNCGIEDAIDNGITGFLIEGNDSKALKNSLDNILENKLVFQENSREWAKQHDWSQLIKRYIALIP